MASIWENAEHKNKNREPSNRTFRMGAGTPLKMKMARIE